jgi:hypothetical protein
MSRIIKARASGKNTVAANGKGNGKTTAKTVAPPRPKAIPHPEYFASIYPGPNKPLPTEFAELVDKLEQIIRLPVWLLVQNEKAPWGEISGSVFKGFQSARADIEVGKPLVLLLESPGGEPDSGFRIARMLQRCTGNQLLVAVPQYAKSTATLVALAAKHLLIGRDAELGPLDVHIFDFEREEYGSALNTVKSLERLHAFALTAIDQTMMLLPKRMLKRTDVILPHVLSYVAEFLKPLLEKIDTADYTKKSRDLKLTEEYAVRLMKPNYPFERARRIARQLVEKYPTHGFVIDRAELAINTLMSETETFGLGLNLCTLFSDADMAKIELLFEAMVPYLDSLTVVGRIKAANDAK